MVILKIGVRNLEVQMCIRCLMSPILHLVFIPVLLIYVMLLTSNRIPKDINLFVQSRSKFLQNNCSAVSPRLNVDNLIFYSYLYTRNFIKIRLKPAHTL